MTKEYLEAAVRDASEAEAYAEDVERAFIAAMRHVVDYSSDMHLVHWALRVIAEMEGRVMSDDLVEETVYEAADALEALSRPAAPDWQRCLPKGVGK